MKFKFSYEKLLEYYHQQEEIARRDYNESLTRLEEERGRQNENYRQFDDALAATFEARDNPKGSEIAKLEHLGEFMKGQEIRIARQREIIINHTQIVEQKQEILIAAAREVEILIKLKEKKQAEFKKLEKKKETKLNDELVVTRFKKHGTWGEVGE